MNLWGRLGISVAFAALFSIFMTEALQTTAYYEKFKWHLCGAFAGAGIFIFLIGRSLNKGWRAKQEAEIGQRKNEDPDNQEVPEDRFLLINLAYWGVMLLLFGAITAFIVPRPKVVKAASVPVKTNSPPRATPKPAPVAAAPVPTNHPAVVPEFPNLSVQGISYSKENPSVLINAKTLRVGDTIAGAKVVAINPYGATVLFDGRYKTLAIGK